MLLTTIILIADQSATGTYLPCGYVSGGLVVAVASAVLEKSKTVFGVELIFVSRSFSGTERVNKRKERPGAIYSACAIYFDTACAKYWVFGTDFGSIFLSLYRSSHETSFIGCTFLQIHRRHLPTL